jgi:hypothetical protein
MRSLLYFAAVLTFMSVGPCRRPPVRATVRERRRRPLPGLQSRSSGQHLAVPGKSQASLRKRSSGWYAPYASRRQTRFRTVAVSANRTQIRFRDEDLTFVAIEFRDPRVVCRRSGGGI